MLKPLDAERVRSLLPQGFLADARVFGVVGSTNDLARRLARQRSGRSLLVLAEAQTAGRGRRNRRWFSPPGVGLWFSLVLWPKLHPAEISPLGLLASVAVASALCEDLELEAKVKWPNDVWVGGRKVCGILSELEEVRGRQCAILGIGINVNQQEADFPEDLRGAAASLRMLVGSIVERDSILRTVLHGLAARYACFDESGFAPFREEWEALSLMTGRVVRVESGANSVEGVALGLTEAGALRVSVSEDCEHEVVAGDVRIVDDDSDH
ncbi:MAG: biotin--[acetyl-CoA-carboxylase] ligase [Candidatus Eisenbacteria sp.]|nr:biotin--[acetyl-CoA-carboxylase] ligase [Candidatus Eisenbacteria bacterium]